jgi:hypothetical protein
MSAFEPSSDRYRVTPIVLWVAGPSMQDSDVRSRPALRAQIRIAGETEKKLEFVGASWILIDGNVPLAGELPRQRPRWRRAPFDPRSALRAHNGQFGDVLARRRLIAPYQP